MNPPRSRRQDVDDLLTRFGQVTVFRYKRPRKGRQGLCPGSYWR